MKKLFATLLILPWLTGCYAFRSGIPLFNNHGYHYTPNSVEVQKGDTLYSLSKKYDIPLQSIIKENKLRAPYNLKVGQILYFPANQTYTVEKGDTLYAISRKHDMDIASLIEYNHLEEPYAINVGQVLTLPQNVSKAKVAKKKEEVHSTTKSTANNKQKTITKTAETKVTKPTVTSKQIASNKQIVKSSSQKIVSTNRKSKFIWPVNGSVVSNFGVVGKGLRNDGINIKAALGTNVKAADKGVVAYAGNELKGFGNLILIKHADGYITAYAHNDKLYVKKGQNVLRGEKIATVGSTGSVNTPQLHFEVRAGKKAVNPRAYLP